MKKRRIALFSFLLAAGVSMGIGFAALSDSFTIYGDLGANIDNSNLVVVFDGEETETAGVSFVDGERCFFATDSGAAAIDGKTACELTFKNLTTAGQTATAHLRVENRSTAQAGDELDAQLSDPVVKSTNLDSTLFEITAAWESNDKILEAGEDTNHNCINVTVILKRTPTASVTAQNFEITFTATTLP